MKLRIRELREDRDLKQQQVAKDMLCDQSLYSKYERGERPLPLELADRLADYFETSVDYLLGNYSGPPVPEALPTGPRLTGESQ